MKKRKQKRKNYVATRTGGSTFVDFWNGYSKVVNVTIFTHLSITCGV